MRTIVGHQADTAAGVSEGDQALAEQQYPNGIGSGDGSSDESIAGTQYSRMRLPSVCLVRRG